MKFARFEPRRVLRMLRGVASHLTFVRDAQVKVGEEGLSWRRGFEPVRAAVEGAGRRVGRERRGFRVGRVEVEIGLARPCDVVTRFAQQAHKCLGRVDELRAHMMRADRGRIHPCHQPGTARRADGRMGESAGEARAFAGEPIHVRRDRLRIVVTSQRRAGVVKYQPDDVRLFLRLIALGAGRQNSVVSQADGRQRKREYEICEDSGTNETFIISLLGFARSAFSFPLVPSHCDCPHITYQKKTEPSKNGNGSPATHRTSRS